MSTLRNLFSNRATRRRIHLGLQITLRKRGIQKPHLSRNLFRRMNNQRKVHQAYKTMSRTSVSQVSSTTCHTLPTPTTIHICWGCSIITPPIIKVVYTNHHSPATQAFRKLPTSRCIPCRVIRHLRVRMSPKMWDLLHPRLSCTIQMRRPHKRTLSLN